MRVILLLASICFNLSFVLAAPLPVVGGEPILAEEAASLSIVNIKMKFGMCTGTLIGPNVVLAAAHCVDLFGPATMVARIGAGATEPCAISALAESAFFPEAKRDLPRRVHTPDILLLKLESPLCGAKPAVIQREPLVAGDVVNSAGHGRGNKVFGQAEKISLRVIDNEGVGALSTATDPISLRLLEVGKARFQFALPVASGSSFCDGDSGGPIYREENGVMQVFGVNSAKLPNEKLGAASCDFAYLQMITPVAPYADWIEAKILEWQPK